MRVLFTSTPLPGHLHPLVPFARALAARGHEVAFATPPAGVPLAEGAGFRAFPVGSATDAVDLAGQMGVDLAPMDGPARSAFAQRHYFAGPPALERARALLALCAEWRPALVVREDMELAGALAAERQNLPHASLQVILRGRTPARLAPLLEGLRELRCALGLPPDPEGQMLHRHLLLWPLPPGLRHPDALVPDTARAVRPVPFDRSGGEALPPWVDELPPREERPRVYATLGTASLFRADAVYGAILRALADAPVSAMLTLGRDRDPAALGPQPPHVRLERYVPQTLLLPHCDAVLFHGGSGTLAAALDHGLPMVVIPFAADQPQNAEAVAASGAGIMLPRESLTPEALRCAVLEVLREPGYRARAAALGRELRALPGPEVAAAWLERLANRRALGADSTGRGRGTSNFY